MGEGRLRAGGSWILGVMSSQVVEEEEEEETKRRGGCNRYQVNKQLTMKSPPTMVP